MATLTAGPRDAPTVILLHGWGASKEIWKLVFRSPLTDRYRLIAPDLPGTGDAAILEDSSTGRLADWVAAEAGRMGIDRYAVVGHSMGGNVATQVGILYPKQVTAVVLVDAALHSDRLTAANLYLHRMAGPITLGGARYLAGVAGWAESRLALAENPGWLRGYARRAGYMMFNNSIPGLRAQLRGLLGGPADIRQLPTDLPVLLLHGENDSTIPVAWSREALEARPVNTELVIYPDALHCPMDTHTQKFTEDIADFLDRSAQSRS